MCIPESQRGHTTGQFRINSKEAFGGLRTVLSSQLCFQGKKEKGAKDWLAAEGQEQEAVGRGPRVGGSSPPLASWIWGPCRRAGPCMLERDGRGRARGCLRTLGLQQDGGRSCFLEIIVMRTGAMKAH